MIATTRKYASVENFILDNANYRNEKFSLIMNVCNAVKQEGAFFNIDNKCFYCNFCYFDELLPSYREKFEDIKTKYPSISFFKEEMINLPNSKFFIENPQNMNLYTFTSIEETKRIQLWATALLTNCSSEEVITAIEIPAPNELFDRNGRIDIGAKSREKFMFIEAKTTLSDAMVDERFVEQHSKYSPTIKKYLLPDDFTLLILIGGREDILHPPGSVYNKVDIGNLSNRFYKLIGDSPDKIPFISAPALWALSVKYMEDKSFDIITFLDNLFSEKNVYGLLTSGKIVKAGDEYKVVNITF